MKNRAFGVEIECYGSSWDEEDYVEYTLDLLIESGFATWATSYDDSLEDNGVEVISPVLKGQEGIEQVRKVVALLNQERFYVDKDCGLHVHHDAPEFVDNKILVRRFIDAWMNNQEHFASLVDESRWDNEYSELWVDADADAVFGPWESYGEMGYSKRGAFNLSSLFSHGSIEIRLHEGTLDADEIEHWIKLGNSFVDHVYRVGAVSAIDDPIRFLKRIGVEKNTIGYFSHRYERK